MIKKELDFDEVLLYLEKLPFNKFKEVVYHYSTHTKANFESELEDMISLNFQQRIQKLKINNSCPKCNSVSIIKYGKRKRIQRYLCNDCNTRFTLFTGTILEKTKWHWDIWIAVLNMTINSFSLKKMEDILIKDYGCIGINHKTLFLWKHKLIHTIASLSMPKLSGVIQVAETFIRESQKGSRSLVSYLGKGEERKPRYGRKPSKFGVMGSEFATVTTAIDNRGYSVSKVACLGKLTTELFTTLFEEYLFDPSYICSDANSVYEQYCKAFNVAHYIRPSNYISVLYNNGYDTPNYSHPSQAKDTEEKNKKVLESLYGNNMIDYISNRGVKTYNEFEELKTLNRLSLARVNELHADIKDYIYGHMVNVSTKYLQDYIGFFTYIRNWRVTNGNYPSSMKDTEQIFIDILKTKVKYTVADINKKELVLPKPSTRYIGILKAQTEKIRIATSNKYFKFDEEDGVKSFNRREYLLDQPKSKLYAICKNHDMIARM
jgi:transposase-like protein